MNYQEKYKSYLSQFETSLAQVCEQYLPTDSRVSQAARYSLLAGGKRVRAILTMACCEMLGTDSNSATAFACAVEMLHCFSLIHDDLPCMDNDDFRRGKPSCHKAFDEATALLAGDVLLTEAFNVIAQCDASDSVKVRACHELAKGGGSKGMIFGQELDLTHEGKPVTEEVLRKIHRNKTGALINAAVQMGVCAANGTTRDHELLERYAFGLGLVFQIVDDVLDVTSTPEELGKPIGSDAENGKVTFVTLYGEQGAMDLAHTLNEQICNELCSAYGHAADFLIQLAQELLIRRN